MMGANIHVAPATGPSLGPTLPFLQSLYNSGVRHLRAICQWTAHESTQGVWNTTARTTLDTFITNCVAVGIYVELELHLNVSSLIPVWATGADDTAKAVNTVTPANGAKFIIQAMANRYGNPASPQYTKAVTGFGFNEPPIAQAELDKSTSIAYLEGLQKQMLAWVREFAPSWIGYVAWAYANQSPTLTGTGTDSLPRVSAVGTAYDSLPGGYPGGNVVYDLHDYCLGTTSTTNATESSRQGNGTIYPTYQPGGFCIVATGAGGLTYSSNSVKQGQIATYITPYKDWSVANNKPIRMGEIGWDAGNTGESPWWADTRAAMTTAGFVQVLQWIGATVLTSQDPWTSHDPSMVIRPELTTLFSNQW